MRAPRLDIDGDVAVITLSDPDGVNALDHAYVAALRETVVTADAHPTAAAILLRAEGRAFCAGGDVAWFAELGDEAYEPLRALIPDATALITTLHTSAKPVVAAVHGALAGAGLGIAMACDIVLAAEGTTFAMAYAHVGACPDLGVSTFLVRDAGYRRAFELCVLGEVIGAAEARELGMINRVLPGAALDAEARALAARLAAGPRDSTAMTKRLLRTAAGTPLPAHLAAELQGVAELSRGPEWREGIAAFLARRSPDWPATRDMIALP